MRKRDVREKIERFEGALWEAERQRPVPFPGKGFEERVMCRIREERGERAGATFMESLGKMAWRLAPLVAALVIAVVALAAFWPFRDGGEWTCLLTEDDALIEWIMGEGGEA